MPLCAQNTKFNLLTTWVTTSITRAAQEKNITTIDQAIMETIPNTVSAILIVDTREAFS